MLANDPRWAGGVVSREERHAIGHAQYLVDRATPEKSEVCFDYTLVRTLLNVIDRATTGWIESGSTEDEE